MRLAAAGRGIQEKRHTCRFLVNWLFGSREEALEHYGVLKSLLEGMKKRSWNLYRVFFRGMGLNCREDSLSNACV